MKVSIYRNLTDGKAEPDATAEVDPAPIVGFLMNQADKSDPLNQMLVAGFRVGKRFTVRVDHEMTNYPVTMCELISTIVQVAVEHAAEIRDALAMEKS